MRRNFLLLTILSTLAFGSCVSDITENTYTCEEKGEFLGEFLITPASNEYWDYEADQKRIYVNATGQEVTLIANNYFDAISDRTIRNVCGDWSMPIRESDLIRVQRKNVNYRNSATGIYMYLSLESTVINVTEDSEDIVDIIYISAGNAYYNFVIDDRGNSDNIPDYLNKGNLEMISDTSFLGHQFSDIYYDDLFEQPAFFNKSQGIVAFYANDETFYVLDRIE
ncbi:MAG: hypothetical protein ACPG19_03555 [Saprospiraceae bacterium]